MSTLLTSTAVVTLAEIGDKTMLLAMVLAAKLQRPWAVVAGIFAATVANHLLAALVGSEVAGLLDARWFRFAVAAGFLAMAAWTLVPDSLDDDEEPSVKEGSGGWLSAFTTTAIAFFLVEMGDKTQIATIALGARYHDVLTVAAGTTLGMMIADAPAVFLGDRLVRIVPLKLARIVAAIMFAAIGAWQIVDLLR
ncbi:TMEM165/GDT1 family protein [Novosphingobium umbonatum]|uniref:GDT1 family protein n=1 Tax=Novosphingobium umbonatum TaxID=1908524 RepID=A0A3S2UV83_9SPHN|nr:TMEM165/GDT1 family protein [Novosphingobium umbonatum]RVU07939.1 TMEM165/GDT1 family protein [Novosphingobium umbonatum]